MFTLFKRPLYVISNKLRRRQSLDWMKEKWIADFSKPEKACFDIKPEIPYNAYLEKGSLFLGLKKNNCLAWLETAKRVYVNQVIDARFRFDSSGSYCAVGIMFRIAEQGSYYLALVSNRGYFRLDAVNGHIPQTLIDWTETPGIDGNGLKLGIIARNGHIIFLLNGRWVAEVYDTSVPGGHLGFALVSYDTDDTGKTDEYACRAWLDFLSVDSRPAAVEREYRRWNDTIEISAISRFRLAESLAAFDNVSGAYDQILKLWKQRETAVKSITAAYTEIRTNRELLFAARMASRLGLYAQAEEYVNICLTLSEDNSERLNTVLAEKAAILDLQHKYGELVVFLSEYIRRLETETGHADLPPLYALLGLACWNLNDYKAAAAAWDKAFSLNRSNGLYAVSAGRAFEQMGKKTQALERYLQGGECFLQQQDYAELEALIPKVLSAGNNSRKVQTAAAKWADEALNSKAKPAVPTRKKRPAKK